MSDSLVGYLQQFANLRPNVNRTRWTEATRHSAPHKSLLLLSVIQLVEEELLQQNLIEPSPDLCEAFARYWACTLPTSPKGNLALPFYHLSSSSFWHLVPQPGREAELAAVSTIDSLRRLMELVLGARLDEELFALLLDPASRAALRSLLLERYFSPASQQQLLQQLAIDAGAVNYSRLLLADAEAGKVQEVLASQNRYQVTVRDQGFRRAVVTAYDRRCAMCGIRILTVAGHTAVDAAHIDPWCESRNDSPTNGLALCKLCHWAFDEGMLSVDPRHLILVSPQLAANHNIPAHLGTLRDRPLLLPAEPRHWPDPTALRKHRARIYQRC